MNGRPRVLLPVDRLADCWPSGRRSSVLRLGAVLHPASMTGDLRPTLAILEELQSKGRFHLAALFGPQHGFAGHTQDNMIEWEGYMHPRLKIPVHSLYGEYREPVPSMLANLDALLVDLVDVGSRYYTFIWTLFLCMKAAEKRGIPVLVCDRPNPINGLTVEGRPQDPNYLSFVGLHPLPVRHAKTIGELARQFQEEMFPRLELIVLEMEGWERAWYYDETGLPWVMPSPNMPTLDTAIVYPGMCLLEGTNLSEGRGTTRPFEIFGAPWLEAGSLLEALESRSLPGVRFRAISYEPTFQKHAGRLCHGAQLHVTDRHAFEPFRTGVDILTICKELCPDDFAWNPPPYEYEYEKLPIEILLGQPIGSIDSINRYHS